MLMEPVKQEEDTEFLPDAAAPVAVRDYGAALTFAHRIPLAVCFQLAVKTAMHVAQPSCKYRNRFKSINVSSHFQAPNN
jgi:hypothetical protein